MENLSRQPPTIVRTFRDHFAALPAPGVLRIFPSKGFSRRSRGKALFDKIRSLGALGSKHDPRRVFRSPREPLDRGNNQR